MSAGRNYTRQKSIGRWTGRKHKRTTSREYSVINTVSSIQYHQYSIINTPTPAESNEPRTPTQVYIRKYHNAVREKYDTRHTTRVLPPLARSRTQETLARNRNTTPQLKSIENGPRDKKERENQARVESSIQNHPVAIAKSCRESTTRQKSPPLSELAIAVVYSVCGLPIRARGPRPNNQGVMRCNRTRIRHSV